jgi:hypothetical protein
MARNVTEKSISRGAAKGARPKEARKCYPQISQISADTQGSEIPLFPLYERGRKSEKQKERRSLNPANRQPGQGLNISRYFA